VPPGARITHPRPAARRRILSGAMVLLSILLADAGVARAGAWTQPRGHYYGRVSVAGINSLTYFDESGRRVAFRAGGSLPLEAVYEGREIRAYLEYGLRHRLTLYGSGAYKSLALDERRVRREQSGLGDFALGGRFRLRSGGLPASLAGELTLPPGYATDEIPALGAGTLEFTLRGLLGASRGRLYATADGGLRWRGGGYRNQVVGSLEAGGRLSGMLGGRVVLRFERSIDSSGSPPAGGAFDPAMTSPRRATIDGTVSLEIQPGLLLEGTISHVWSGRSALAGNTLEIALVGFGPIAPGR
jgi:hypothetical protein